LVCDFEPRKFAPQNQKNQHEKSTKNQHLNTSKSTDIPLNLSKFSLSLEFVET